MTDDILYLYDADGRLAFVQLAPALWEKVKPLLERQGGRPAESQSDMAAFADFLAAWDFHYPYVPAVECPHCHAHTDNWQKEDSPFILVNANIGGLLVFTCRQCGASIRQKYFKTRMACEFTPPAP